MSLSRCSAWWHLSRPLSPTFTSSFSCYARAHASVQVFRAPIGAACACQSSVQTCRSSLPPLWEGASTLRDPRIAYHLLRHCARTCRLLYILRYNTPYITLSGAEIFDCGLRRISEDLHGAILSRCWTLAELPLRMGCLGLTSTPLIDDIC